MTDVHAIRNIDRLTVIAIAVVAYAGVNITHELIGHCGMALLVWTKCTVVSSTYVPLAEMPPTWKYNLIVAAGSTANFIVALACLPLLRRGAALPHSPPHASAPCDGPGQQAVMTKPGRVLPRSTVRYFLWLLMSVNLFLASTYIAVAPIIKFGDSYIMIQNLPGQLFWRPAVALAGAFAWWCSFRISRSELARLIAVGARAARPIAWNLVLPAYLAGGALTVTSALFSRLDPRIAQLEAAGGTFGLTIWLLLLPFVISPATNTEREALAIPRSVEWIVAGVLTAVIFIGVWGRGIEL